MNTHAVQEEISHGDYHAIRYIEVGLDNVDSVTEMLNSCAYHRLPKPEFGESAYEEAVANQLRHAERISQELSDNGHAEFGWVRYRVLPPFAAAILPIRGWSAEQVERCFGGMSVPAVEDARIARAIRHAHRAAGYAVAACARGGRLITVWLGSTDWDNADGDEDRPPYVRRAALRADLPFLKFAGSWCSAMWEFEKTGEASDFGKLLTDAWNARRGDGLTVSGDLLVEAGWDAELKMLWPAIREVAATILRGGPVTHATVKAAIAEAGLTADELEMAAASSRPVTVEEFSKLSRLSKSTIYSLIRRGKLRTLDTRANPVLLPASELDRWLKAEGAA